MSIVISPEQPAAWARPIREAAGTIEVVTPSNEKEALAAAPEAEGWIGYLTPALLAAAPRLRWLQYPTISLERHMAKGRFGMFPELVASDVTLTNMRHIYDDHISNHMMAMYLSLCRDIPRFIRQQIAREWTQGAEIMRSHVRDPAAMTILIVGLGGVGAELARRLAVFGATVIGVDPRVTGPLPGVGEIALPARLPGLVGRVDAIMICAPETPDTRGLFNEAMFRRMRPETLFFNAGRGKIVDLKALERALREGWIAGAGMDVFEDEPLPRDSPLWEMDRVIVTPHVAWFGAHTAERSLAVAVENVRRFVSGRPLINLADKALWY